MSADQKKLNILIKVTFDFKKTFVRDPLASSISKIEFVMRDSIPFRTFLQNPALPHREHNYVASLDLPLKLSRFDFFFDSSPVIALTFFVH